MHGVYGRPSAQQREAWNWCSSCGSWTYDWQIAMQGNFCQCGTKIWPYGQPPVPEAGQLSPATLWRALSASCIGQEGEQALQWLCSALEARTGAPGGSPAGGVPDGSGLHGDEAQPEEPQLVPAHVDLAGDSLDDAGEHARSEVSLLSIMRSSPPSSLPVTERV